MTNKTQPLSPARAGVGTAVVSDSGSGKTQVLAHSAAVTSAMAPASVWNADGAGYATFGGYSTSPTGTLNADGATNVNFVSIAHAYTSAALAADGVASVSFYTSLVFHADGVASVSFGAGGITGHLNADGLGSAQWYTQPVITGALHADGAASVTWTGIAAANAIWHADGTAAASFFNVRGIGALNADGVTNVAFSANAIANATLNADGSTWVSFSAEAAGPFYFAWITYSETWGPQHLRIDEVVFSFNIVHEEGQCATLELTVKNPFSGFLAFGRRQWCFFSLASRPLFKGRLVSIPSDMTGETLTMHFTAMPLNMLDQQRALADTMMVLPYWDPVWITEAQRLDPQSVLESYSRHWCVDRVTLQVTTSDLIVGEDGVVTFAEGDVFYDSVKPSIDKAPLLNVYVDATVNWTQFSVGTIDMGNKTFDANTGGGILGAWPKAGTDIGSGWFVKHATATDPNFEVKTSTYSFQYKNLGHQPDPFDISYDANGIPTWTKFGVYQNGDLLNVSWSHTFPYLFGKNAGYTSASGGEIDTGGNAGSSLVQYEGQGKKFVTSFNWHVEQPDEPMGFPKSFTMSEAGVVFFDWTVQTKLVIGYKAQRQRTENVRFTLAADMQPIFSDPAEPGASGLAANFAQNSEYMQLNGLVGLEGPFGTFRGNFVGGTQYFMYDIFIVAVGVDTFAYQVQKDHVSLSSFDSATAASAFAGGWYDAGDIFFASGTYWQVLVSGQYPSSPPSSNNVVIDPWLQIPAIVLTLDPYAGKRLYQAVPQFRGNWIANGEVYVSGDMVIAPSGTWYRVAIGHHSAVTFYRFAVDPTGRLLYELMLNPSPIGDVSRRSYFPTDRGNQSLQNLIYRARAKIIARSRALKVEFETHFENVVNSITLRKNAVLTDRRLPGGSALGKVVAYSIKGDGNSGQIIGGVTIACTAGYGTPVVTAAGTPDYVEVAYVGNDYQYFDGVITALGTGDISYTPPSDVGATIDDGLNFPLTKSNGVLSESVNGIVPTIVTQPIMPQNVALGGADLVGQAISAVDYLQGVVDQYQQSITNSATWYILTLPPVQNGPFAAQYDVTVNNLQLPEQINLSAPASP